MENTNKMKKHHANAMKLSAFQCKNSVKIINRLGYDQICTALGNMFGRRLRDVPDYKIQLTRKRTDNSWITQRRHYYYFFF